MIVCCWQAVVQKSVRIDSTEFDLSKHAWHMVLQCKMGNPTIDSRSWYKTKTGKVSPLSGALTKHANTHSQQPVMLVKQFKHTDDRASSSKSKTIKHTDVISWYHKATRQLEPYNAHYELIYAIITNRKVTSVDIVKKACPRLLIVDRTRLAGYVSPVLVDLASLAVDHKH